MRVRSIESADLPALLALAQSTGVGVTTLPANAERLGRRIDASLATLAQAPDPARASLLFVLDDPARPQHVVGICGLEGALGMSEPWYNYRVGAAVHASRELGLYRRLETLFLSNDLTGAAELCSLFLHPD